MNTIKQKKQAALEEKRAVRQAKNKEVNSYKYLMTISYDGSRYGGYAKQKHKNTIQNVLEWTLAKLFHEDIKTTESSRTDAKVHALNQKVTFNLNKDIDVVKTKSILNEMLPRDIIIVELEKTLEEFHCRHHVKSKTYSYKISHTLDPRNRNYSWYLPKDLDIDKMREASNILLGTHDFSTFKSAKATTESSIRTVNYIEINKTGDGVEIIINADGFLFNMVRLIVKALVDVGSSKERVSYIKDLLELRQKPHHLESAPAQGLCLTDIYY